MGTGHVVGPSEWIVEGKYGCTAAPAPEPSWPSHACQVAPGTHEEREKELRMLDTFVGSLGTSGRT